MLDQGQIKDIANFIQQEIVKKNNANKNYNVNLFENLNNGDHYVEYGMSNRQYTYVEYETGMFAFFEYEEGTMAVSSGFSGCIMAKFRAGNKWYIAHLSNDTQYRWTENWYKFVNNNNVTEYYLFYPAGGNDEFINSIPGGAIPGKNYSAVGVIDKFNNCYGIFYEGQTFKFGNGIYAEYKWDPFTNSQRVQNGNVPKTSQYSTGYRRIKIESSCCIIL